MRVITPAAGGFAVPHPHQVLAHAMRPAGTDDGGPWIIDGTLIPVHDQSITALSKNYPRSVNTQIIMCAQPRTVTAVGRCWPGNRNDGVVARHTVAHLLDGTRTIPGDVTADTAASPQSPDRAAEPMLGSSTTTTTANTAASAPASSTSSPGSKTGQSCGNADAAAKRSTTAFASSPRSGTSKPRINYGSTLSGVRLFWTRLRRGRRRPPRAPTPTEHRSGPPCARCGNHGSPSCACGPLPAGQRPG